jgi:hypothetical protein
MLHPSQILVVAFPTWKRLIPPPNMRVNPVFVTCLGGLFDFGMIVSQRPFRGPVHFLNLRIIPPEPVQTNKVPCRIRHAKTEFLQVGIEAFKAFPRKGFLRALRIRLDVDAQNHRNPGIHTRRPAMASLLNSPKVVRLFKSQTI